VGEMILNLDIQSNQMIPKFLLVIPKNYIPSLKFLLLKIDQYLV